MNKKSLIVPILLAALILSGCNFQAAMNAAATEEAQSNPEVEWETYPATVTSFDIQILAASPLGIELTVEGTLQDGCSELGDIHQAYDSGRFIIEMTARRPQGQSCGSIEPQPYEKTILLEDYSLDPGTYTIDINGSTDSFSITEDMLQPEQDSPGTSTISGRIFHDECAVLKDDSGVVIESSEGCIEEDGITRADGAQDGEEKGITGVLVSLGNGECPSTGLAETTTGSGGAFSFAGLSAGDYCVSITPENTRNSPLLVPGSWTVEATIEGSISVSVGSERVPETLFGWDYEFLPVLDEADCENAFEFIDDVTIPDDTEMEPGGSFEKIWRLRNSGTCTWSPEYSLVYTDGDRMNSPDAVSLPSTVEPGDTVDISVDFSAPGSDGTYRSDWKMKTPDGTTFGTGQDNDLSIWVQIKVGTVTALPDFGSPDYTEEFNSASAWYTGEDSHTSFSVQNGSMVMIGKQPESWDGWSITSAYLSDFYIEMKAETGTCSGLDRYGLMVRAPDLARGYLIGFSCDGRYSIRLWDGENYQVIRDWASSGHIKSGSNQTNRLGILAEGSSFSIYANEILLAEVDDSTYSEGRYGVFVASSATSNFRVEVDSVSYWSSP